jgi:hypothetical protein
MFYDGQLHDQDPELTYLYDITNKKHAFNEFFPIIIL